MLIVSNFSHADAQYPPSSPRNFENYYSTFEDIGKVQHLDGFTGETACRQMGGKLVIGTIDAKPVSVVVLCEFRDYYFKLLEAQGIICPANVHQWKDPKTGEIFELGGCISTSSCNAPGVSGIYADNSYGADEVTNTIPISADGKEFQVKFIIKEIGGCSSLSFIEEEKKISIKSWVPAKAIISLTIPKELLSGEFTVLLDGNRTNYALEETEGYSIVNTEFDVTANPNPRHSIDIVGTQAIPEFPIVTLLLVVGILAIVLVTRRSNQISSFIK